MSESTNSTADYEVGFGKPPKEHQFKAGESGNFNGRPRKKRGESNNIILARILEEKIEIKTPNGKVMKVTIREAIIWRKSMLALKGDHRAAAWVEDRDIAQDEFNIEEFDIEEFLDKL